MTDIYLVRHPETDWNADKRYQGRTGRPLTRRGAASLAGLAAYLRDSKPDRVVSSPAPHALVLARAVADGYRPAGDVVVDESWQEIDHGRWEGLDYFEVLRRFGPAARRRFDDPLRYRGHGGETLAEADRRVRRCWSRLLALGDEGTVVVVSHATPIRLVLCRCLGVAPVELWRFPVDNGGVSRIRAGAGITSADLLNRRVQP